jgi:hypothetical protein
MNVGLVACVAGKLDHAAPARELYCSQLFRAASTYAEREYDAWYVLSALYGLVRPDEVILPYNVTLLRMSGHLRRDWGWRVRGQLRELPNQIGMILYLHAGAPYRDALDAVSWGWPVVVPLEGLMIGQQLHWYAERRPA